MTLMNYAETESAYGSHYSIEKAISRGEINRIEPGLYSDHPDINPYAVITKKYPGAIITMDSAFYLHNLTVSVPNRIHVATLRSALRIKDVRIKQYFAKEEIFSLGKIQKVHTGFLISIYSRERMLVELMRNHQTLPLDYYKEIINSYRNIIGELCVQEIEEYISAFERRDYMYRILEREVF